VWFRLRVNIEVATHLEQIVELVGDGTNIQAFEDTVGNSVSIDVNVQ